MLNRSFYGEVKMNTTVKIPELLKEIFALAESGKFDLSELTDHPDAERGDVVIGEMTPFEKAAFVVSSRLMDELNNLEKARVNDGAEIDGAKAQRLVQAREVCSMLLWASVYDRMDAEYIGEKWKSLSLLEGGQIAAIPYRNVELFKTLVEAFAREMVAQEDCDTCPNYDTCDMPGKKPR